MLKYQRVKSKKQVFAAHMRKFSIKTKLVLTDDTNLLGLKEIFQQVKLLQVIRLMNKSMPQRQENVLNVRFASYLSY